jgi:hypothetical protein
MVKNKRPTNRTLGTSIRKRAAHTDDSQNYSVSVSTQKRQKDNSNKHDGEDGNYSGKNDVNKNNNDNHFHHHINNNNNMDNAVNTNSNNNIIAVANSTSSNNISNGNNSINQPRQQPRVLVTVDSENNQIQQKQQQLQPPSASSSISSKNIIPVDLHGFMSSENSKGVVSKQHNKDENDFAEFVKQKQSEYVEWRKQQGGTTSLQEQRHTVHRYVRTKLFPKLKFITCDSELDFTGKAVP